MNHRTVSYFMCVVFGCYMPLDAKPPSISVSSLRNTDAIEVLQKQRQAIIDIHSSRGIGTATLVRNACEWPEELRLRLYLNGLESLKLTAGKQEVRIEVSSHSKQRADILVEDEQGKSIPPDHALHPVVSYKQPSASAKQPSYFEVVVPAGLLKSEVESLTISWIDFYR